ncbi:Anaerobic glycerol-3-phosphate dehydrogenase subunit C [Geodia barretti]|uniref:Anaerobic glycerol-3-phosphate dehydrogenase subunit C n=1 Tax=Geodia barretti TaxID=519541 RepID=A0AA35TG52_GEOBA|nr:Anaerobic glycerol-3-phosphate dehydrogenase subunit C [Geodia barretti]
MAVESAIGGTCAAGSQPAAASSAPQAAHAAARGGPSGPGAGAGTPAAAAAARAPGGVREGVREGSLEAPTRHPIDWRNPEFYNEESLNAELERVFDICHGCRRCVSLCNAFPTLFDLVDESETMEVDGVSRSDYGKVVEQCYLCDLCYMTKCPYVPPHEWNVDFPHLMLRAKAVNYRDGKVKLRDRLITKTDVVGRFASLPVIVNAVNAANRSKPVRAAMDAGAGIHREANLPPYDSKSIRRRLRKLPSTGVDVAADTPRRGGSGPASGDTPVPVRLAPSERCCAMPRLELGDLESVEKAKNENVPVLAKLADEGFDIVAPVPSCVLMFKQELPLMFPEDERVAKVRAAIYDPFEYLAQRHREGLLRTDFRHSLGTVAYHAACHQRVQNIGSKTRDVLGLVPDTRVSVIERCSGHDGTYAVKRESYAHSMKIVRPVVRRVRDEEPDHFGSDCPMAGNHIAHGLGDGRSADHPLTLLRKAYGI